MSERFVSAISAQIVLYKYSSFLFPFLALSSESQSARMSEINTEHFEM